MKHPMQLIRRWNEKKKMTEREREWDWKDEKQTEVHTADMMLNILVRRTI